MARQAQADPALQEHKAESEAEAGAEAGAGAGAGGGHKARPYWYFDVNTISFFPPRWVAKKTRISPNQWRMYSSCSSERW